MSAYVSGWGCGRDVDGMWMGCGWDVDGDEDRDVCMCVRVCVLWTFFGAGYNLFST